MTSGVYHINIGPHPSLELKFTSMVVKQPPVSTAEESKFASVCHISVEQKWKEDKIQDFVQRLGFYDAIEEGQSGVIEKFNNLNEVRIIISMGLKVCFCRKSIL